MNNDSLDQLKNHILNGRPDERELAFKTLYDMPFELIEEFLFQGLRNNNHLIRRYCARILGEKGNETVIFPLLQAMSDDSWAIRNSAQEAFKQLPVDTVLPVLRGIISSSAGNIPMLKSLAKVLADFSHGDASSLLINLLQDTDDPGLIKTVTNSLGKKGDEFSITHLFHLLAHEYWEVRKAAVNALTQMPLAKIGTKLQRELSSSNRFIHLSVVEILITKGDDDVLDLMTETISSKLDLVRQNTLNVLEGIGNDECLGLMISLLADGNSSIRNKVIKILGNSNSDFVTKSLKRCLKSSNNKIRQGAIKAFGNKKTDSIVDLLENLLNDNSGDDRMIILESLATIGTRKCIKIILKSSILYEETEKAASMLRVVDPDLAVQQLVNMLDKSNDFPTVVRVLSEFDRVKVLRYLGSKLGTGTPNEQEKVIETMGLLGIKGALPYLEKLLDGGFSSNVEKAAKLAIERLNKLGS